MTTDTQKQFRFIVDGHVHNVLLDKATMALIPLKHKSRGYFQDYVNEAILSLWIKLYNAPDPPELTRGQMVLRMARDTGATNSAVIRCACAFHVGNVSS